MFKPKKPNTSEEVLRRIEKLRETLSFILDLSKEGSVGYKIKPIPVRRNIVDFLSGHEVDISLVKSRSLEERLGVNSQPELDLAERTYRLSDKVLLKNYEERNPVPLLDSVLALFSGVKDNKAIIEYMTILSDIMTIDQHEILPAVILDAFPGIVNYYGNVLESIKKSATDGVLEEKTLVAQNTYTKGVEMFLKTTYELVKSYSDTKTGQKELIRIYN